VENEVPSGVIDGMNATFSTSQVFRAGTTRLYLNGVRQRTGASFDYVESGSSNVVFSLAPKAGDTLLIDYTRG
jgi:hypothetical protein